MTTQSTLFTRRSALRFTALALAAGAASCATQSPQVYNAPGNDQTAAALPLVNALRAKNGLPALGIDPAAKAAALYQAKRMASLKKMAHFIGFGDDFGRRVKASGVKLPAAENIAEGQQTVDAVVNAWIHSPHHLENMLGHYTGLGVALARDPSSNNLPYWSMVLSSNAV
ncbi:CAP domain-containing protein [Neorhizobium sp. P12A]|uniref:CAP domain-containing protein n=1 Tax=Neorhizobium sp. P12A TaxID=2268027 RepID=UPI0011EF3D93|nr:CAP domain-containing protein [Neorhizobium sp. P12A]KAA0699425.1 CAP domain-containing protein [Neorhizobium sp. P12A]